MDIDTKLVATFTFYGSEREGVKVKPLGGDIVFQGAVFGASFSAYVPVENRLSVRFDEELNRILVPHMDILEGYLELLILDGTFDQLREDFNAAVLEAMEYANTKRYAS